TTTGSCCPPVRWEPSPKSSAPRCYARPPRRSGPAGRAARPPSRPPPAGGGVLRAAAETFGAGGARRAPVERALRRVLDPAHPRTARLGPLLCERSGRWVRVGPPARPDLGTREWGGAGGVG